MSNYKHNKGKHLRIDGAPCAIKNMSAPDHPLTPGGHVTSTTPSKARTLFRPLKVFIKKCKCNGERPYRELKHGILKCGLCQGEIMKEAEQRGREFNLNN